MEGAAAARGPGICLHQGSNKQGESEVQKEKRKTGVEGPEGVERKKKTAQVHCKVFE